MPQHNSFHRRQLREHCLPVPLSPIIADSNRTNTCPLVVLILDQNWTKDSSILLIIYLQALNQQYFGHSHLDFLPVRVREEWSLGCVHSCPSACIVQCQLRHSSDPHHITRGAKGQWIKQWQLATRLTEWVASLLKWLLSFCQHGHTVSETPCTWYWPWTHRCYQREGFFEEKEDSVPDSPKILQKDFGGASQRVWSVRLWFTVPHAAHFLATLHEMHDLPPSHPWHSLSITSANRGIREPDPLAQKNWRWVAPFSHMELWKMLLQNNMNLATTKYTKRASFRELGERAGCESSFG